MKNQHSITQQEIVNLIESVKKEVEQKKEPRKWKKYYGDVVVRIFREFILKEMPSRYTLSTPNAYIEGFSTEFDLLLVNKNAKPKKYTNMYHPEKVKLGFEIKAHGIFGGREDLEKYIKNIKCNFDSIRRKYPHINFVYLTYEEVVFTRRKTSIQYLEETIRILKPYKVFCLRDSRTGKLIDGEWEKLASFINGFLQRGS